MKEKYKKLDQKMAFLLMLSLKLEIKVTTLQGYFTENGTIPPKHQELINRAIDLQLEADEKIREIENVVFEQLQYNVCGLAKKRKSKPKVYI